MKTKILCSRNLTALVAILISTSFAFAADHAKGTHGKDHKHKPPAAAAGKPAHTKPKMSLKEAFATADQRSVASDSKLEVKLPDRKLRERVLAMRYCDFIVKGGYVTTFTFHRNGTVTHRAAEGDPGAYDAGGPYTGGGAYGGVVPTPTPPTGNAYDANAYSGDAYGGAYGAAGMSGQGKWSISKGKVFFNFDGDVRMIRLSNKSFSEHRCYLNGADVR